MKSKKGSSLVEVLIATIILGVLAIGGATALFLPRSAISYQRNKHIALAEASRLMELIRAGSYVIIGDENIHYLLNSDYPGGTFSLDPTYQNWSIPINGKDYPARIEVQRVSEVSPKSEYVNVSIRIEFQSDPVDAVTLNSSFSRAILNGGL